MSMYFPNSVAPPSFLLMIHYPYALVPIASTLDYRQNIEAPPSLSSSQVEDLGAGFSNNLLVLQTLKNLACPIPTMPNACPEKR